MRRRSSSLVALAVLVSIVWVAPASEGAAATPEWHDLDQRVRPPSATDSMLAYDETRHELILYGGVGSEAQVGTWVFRNETWTKLQPATEPTARYGSSMVYDPIREEIVLFGGWGAAPTGGNGNSTNNQTWIWNGETWRLATPAHSPSSRAFAAAAFDRERGEVVLFGGITGDGTGSATIHGDTWTWDGTDWTKVTPETSPSGRHSVGSAYDPVRGEFVIFGGERDISGMPAAEDPCEVRDPIGNSCVVNVPSSRSRPASVIAETWVWDGITWTQRTPESAPRERMNPRVAWDPATERVLLFGGVHPSRGASTDTWLWDGTNWTEVQPPNHPSHRFGMALASDPDSREVRAFGGHQVTNYARDTWGWDGTTWSLLDRPPTPEPRYFPASAYDSARGETVIFGGDGHRRFGDTWVFDEVWQQRTPATSPPARSAAAAAFDDARDEVVLFGGHSPQDRADTWLWNGTTWREASPETSPPARRHAVMVYDSVRKETVLFGGAHVLSGDECPVTCDAVQELGDTWTWNGSSWTKEQPALSPRPLQETSMVFDPARGEAVLFGGLDGSSQFNSETWTWNGQTWTLEQPATSPPARADAQMTYDPILQTVVMFSGLRSGSPPADMWMWDGSTWTEISTAGAPRGRRGGVFVFDPQMRGTLLYGGTGGGPRDDTWLLRLGGVDPEPTETPTETPSGSPTQTPPIQGTDVSFTSSSRASGQHSDQTAFEARLTDAEGDPVANERVTFELAGADSTRTFEAITNQGGFAAVFPRLHERPGAHVLTARFAGTDQSGGSVDTTTFVVTKEDSDLRLSIEGKSNDRLLRARLVDLDSATSGIAGATIDFYADSELMGSAVTDVAGVTTFQPGSRFRSGKHVFEARFEGNDYFSRSSGQKQT